MPEDGTPDGGGDGGEQPPGFKPPATQDEFDRMVANRLNRERQKFADYDELKEKAAKFDEADAASKSEVQRLQDQLADRDAKLADLPKQARSEAIRFASKATAKGFHDPEDALLFIEVDDLSDGAAVDQALDELAERKPHLLRSSEPVRKKPAARKKPAGGNTESTDGGDPDQLEGKERAAAALRGMRNT